MELCNILLNLFPLIPPSVPKPNVQVNVSENSIHGIFIGHNVTLGCLATVDLSIDTDVVVSFTWKLEALKISTTPRTVISETEQSTINAYFSKLQVLEIDREFEGRYTCGFEVLPIDSKEVILSAEANDEVELTVKG